MSNTIAFAERYFPYIFKGTIVTIELTVVSLLISICLGLIAAIAKLSGHRVASAIANVYIELIRGTPALLQLFIIYFGLTSYGVSLDFFHCRSPNSWIYWWCISCGSLPRRHPVGGSRSSGGSGKPWNGAQRSDAADYPAASLGVDAAALYQFRHRVN